MATLRQQLAFNEARKAEVKVWTNDQLVRCIAQCYDDKEPYVIEWNELVSRVGAEEAERMVDLA